MALYSYTGKSKVGRALHLLVPVASGGRPILYSFHLPSFLVQAPGVHKFFHEEIAFFLEGNIITNHSH
jgi:hypothetical protein